MATMTVARLKELIANLPDDMPVVKEVTATGGCEDINAYSEAGTRKLVNRETGEENTFLVI